MKVKVIKTFVDRNDNMIQYFPGDIIEMDDIPRAENCIGRKLVVYLDEKPDKMPDQPKLEDLKVEDLKKLAAAAGIDAGHYKKKAELIEAIQNAE